MADQQKLRIAISGGGLAGAAIANALFRQPHLDVQIYESAPEFSERGQAVGLGVHAQQALKRLVPDAEGLFTRAGAVLMNSSRLVLGHGPAAGTTVIDIAEANQSRILHRAALLHELLATVPRDRMHAGKKLVDVRKPSGAGGPLELRFEDGSIEVADALIGADGIFGFVRSHVLGADDSAVEPVAAGWSGAWKLLPFEKARDGLGAKLFEEDRQYGWVGDGGMLLHDVLNDRTMIQLVATSVDFSTTEHKKSIDREYLQKAFSSWMDGPIAKNFIDLLAEQDDLAIHPQWEHRNAHTYVRESVCIVGDAAHGMTPWQGSGAATALEDAVILGAVFASITSPGRIEDALRAYDAVCRPRSQRIAASSRRTGKIMCGQDADVGIDAEKMRSALKERWDFISDFDLNKHVERALVILDN